jgi:N-acyl-D-amino-acid deacylase
MRVLRRQCVLGITGVLASLALQAASAQEEQKRLELFEDDNFPVTGEAFTSLLAIDSAMKSILREHQFPGASLAIAREGRLLFARGYGYADREQNRFVTPHSLFRIASISKPITAVAVLKLVEQGKLALDAKIWSLLGISEPKDARWKDITIRNLLNHSGGWDRDASFDAMFKPVEFAKEAGMPPPANQPAVIAAMLTRDLDFAPGAKYAYSNFGYCLLGRAIEKVTGETYEAFVQRAVLRPTGAARMRLGATRSSDTAAGEVKYYDNNRTGPSVFAEDVGQKVPTPYGCWNLEAMDAHGGWVSSALDLVRWGSYLLTPTAAPILSRSMLDAMFAPPPGSLGHDDQGAMKKNYYALGWSVRHGKETAVNHTGSLPGTSTLLLMHRESRTVWAALFNTRTGVKNTLPSQVVQNAIPGWKESIQQWPTLDLFPRFS